jgi:hypothetical protein
MAQRVDIGIDPGVPGDVQVALASALELQAQFLVTPIVHPRYRRLVVLQSATQPRRSEPLTRSDLLLHSGQWGQQILGKLSPWLQLDSPHDTARPASASLRSSRGCSRGCSASAAAATVAAAAVAAAAAAATATASISAQPQPYPKPHPTHTPSLTPSLTSTQVRKSAEAAFRQEVQFASHLALHALLLPAPSERCVNYAHQP